MGSAFTRGQSYGCHFRTHHICHPTGSSGHPLEHTTCPFENATKSSSLQSPLFKPGSAAEPGGGRLNPNHFTQGGTSIVRDIIACLRAQWPPDFAWHLNFQSSLHHPQSRCATCLSYPNTVFHSCLSSTLSILLALFFSPSIPHSFHFGVFFCFVLFCFDGGSVNTFHLYFFFLFLLSFDA